MATLVKEILNRKQLYILILGILGLGVSILWWLPLKWFLFLILGGAITFLIFLYPFLGLCALAFMIPLENALLVAEGVTALKILGVLVFLSWLIHFLLRRQDKVFVPQAVTLSILFAGWGFLSYFWAAYPDVVLWWQATVILLIGFLFLVPQVVANERRLHYLILSNVLGAIVAGAFGLYYFALNPDQRIVAFPEFGQNAGHYGIMISIGIFYFLTTLISKANRSAKIFSLVMFLALLTAAFASGTRSFMVSFAVSLAALFWYFLRIGKVRILAKMSLIFAIIIVTIVSTMPPLFFQRVTSIWTLSEGGIDRLDIWKVFGVVILEHPLLGVGLGNGCFFYGEYLNRAVAYYGIIVKTKAAWITAEGGIGNKGIKDVHNIYLQSWVDLGIFGLIFLLLLIASLLKQLYSSFRATKVYSLEWQLGLVIALQFLALLVTSIAEPELFRKELWFGFSLILAYSRIVKVSHPLEQSSWSRDERKGKGRGRKRSRVMLHGGNSSLDSVAFIS